MAMGKPEILVCVVENGNLIQLSATLSSLKQQTVDQFSLQFISWPAFWSSARNRLPVWKAGTEYVLFLYSGSVLDKDAIEIICEAIKEESSLWLYCDERTFDAEWNGEKAGFQEKPAFGRIGFANYLYAGEAVLFSRKLLEEMQLKYEGNNFHVSLLEMGICAASMADGRHVAKNLLTHHVRRESSQEEKKIISECLGQYLKKRNLPYMGILSSDGKRAYLYPMERFEKKVSLILLSDHEKGLQAENSNFEVIVECGSESYWEKCKQGAQKATGQILCFMDAGCQIPTKEEIERMAGYLQLPEVGIVSPCIEDGEGNILYAGAVRIGNGMCSVPYETAEKRNVPDYYWGTREISVPSWRFWMIEKECFCKVPGTEERQLSPDYVLTDYGLRIEKEGLECLYCGEVLVHCCPDIRIKGQSGFLFMLSEWGKVFAADPYFTAPMAAKALGYKKENTLLYLPEQAPVKAQNDKKILMVTHELSMTGAPVVLSHAARILRDAGWQVVLVSPEDGMLRKTFLEEQIPVLIEESIYEKDTWLSYAGEFDLILVNTVVPFPCIQQLENFPVPVIWWIHDARGGYEAYLKNVLPENLGENIHTLCVSKYAQDVVREFRPQYETELLLYGLPDMGQKEDGKSNGETDAEKKKLFVTVGTVEKRKGQDIFAEAIRLLPEDVRANCKFLFVGKCMEESVFKKVKELEEEYPETVQQVDFIRHEEIFSVYRYAAGVICASRDDPLPTFMAETMMQSGVCICSEHTGTAPLIQNGVNGFVYKNNNPEELADCIRIVAEERMDMESIRKAGRKTFEKIFAEDIFKENLLNYVEQYR